MVLQLTPYPNYFLLGNTVPKLKNTQRYALQLQLPCGRVARVLFWPGRGARNVNVVASVLGDT